MKSRHLAHLSDEALVALVARSDESALAELYDRVGGTAYGLAYRVLRDEALAEDAVQEAFLGLWRSAGSFIPERAKASTWILTLVHRRAVDLVRREQRRRTEPIEGAPEPAVGSAEEAAWLRLDRERVQSALAQLPDQQREAIELAYYGGYTQSELAERLGQPLGTIKSRMFAGLTRLRELLQEGTRDMDLHDLTAGYALDALDPDERARYEEHLASARAAARSCRSSGRSPARSAARPAGRRRRPRCASGSSSRPATSGRTSSRCGAGSRARPRLGGGGGRRRRGRARRLVARAVERPRRRERVLAVLGDPNARVHETADGEANLVVTPTGRAALVVRMLAPAPRGKDYEIWVFENGVPSSAGLFERPGVAMLSRRSCPGRRSP